MFKRNTPLSQSQPSVSVPSTERINSILGPGLTWEGKISGSGGVRIEGTFEGRIGLQGMLVVGESGKVTCENIRAATVIVAGAVKGNITTHKLEIRSTGRIWGDVTTVAFVTEEGAFLRGQMKMEEKVDLGLENQTETANDGPTE